LPASSSEAPIVFNNGDLIYYMGAFAFRPIARPLDPRTLAHCQFMPHSFPFCYCKAPLTEGELLTRPQYETRYGARFDPSAGGEAWFTPYAARLPDARIVDAIVARGVLACANDPRDRAKVRVIRIDKRFSMRMCFMWQSYMLSILHLIFVQSLHPHSCASVVPHHFSVRRSTWVPPAPTAGPRACRSLPRAASARATNSLSRTVTRGGRPFPRRIVGPRPRRARRLWGIMNDATSSARLSSERNERIFARVAFLAVKLKSIQCSVGTRLVQT
jgi:hypothetical protein